MRSTPRLPRRECVELQKERLREPGRGKSGGRNDNDNAPTSTKRGCKLRDRADPRRVRRTERPGTGPTQRKSVTRGVAKGIHPFRLGGNAGKGARTLRRFCEERGGSRLGLTTKKVRRNIMSEKEEGLAVVMAARYTQNQTNLMSAGKEGGVKPRGGAGGRSALHRWDSTNFTTGRRQHDRLAGANRAEGEIRLRLL